MWKAQFKDKTYDIPNPSLPDVGATAVTCAEWFLFMYQRDIQIKPKDKVVIRSNQGIEYTIVYNKKMMLEPELLS